MWWRVEQFVCWLRSVIDSGLLVFVIWNTDEYGVLSGGGEPKEFDSTEPGSLKHPWLLDSSIGSKNFIPNSWPLSKQISCNSVEFDVVTISTEFTKLELIDVIFVGSILNTLILLPYGDNQSHFILLIFMISYIQH